MKPNAARIRRKLDRLAERSLDHWEATLATLCELIDLASEDGDGVHFRTAEGCQHWAALKRDVPRIFADAKRMTELGDELERSEGLRGRGGHQTNDSAGESPANGG